jgi:hypothetical protein
MFSSKFLDPLLLYQKWKVYVVSYFRYASPLSPICFVPWQSCRGLLGRAWTKHACQKKHTVCWCLRLTKKRVCCLSLVLELAPWRISSRNITWQPLICEPPRCSPMWCLADLSLERRKFCILMSVFNYSHGRNGRRLLLSRQLLLLSSRNN